MQIERCDLDDGRQAGVFRDAGGNHIFVYEASGYNPEPAIWVGSVMLSKQMARDLAAHLERFASEGRIFPLVATPTPAEGNPFSDLTIPDAAGEVC